MKLVYDEKLMKYIILFENFTKVKVDFKKSRTKIKTLLKKSNTNLLTQSFPL